MRAIKLLHHAVQKLLREDSYPDGLSIEKYLRPLSEAA